MTLNPNSANRSLRALPRDRQASQTASAVAKPGPLQNSVCHALALLGLGVEGVSCGGDFTAPLR